jgi:hypothetical protein
MIVIRAAPLAGLVLGLMASPGAVEGSLRRSRESGWSPGTPPTTLRAFSGFDADSPSSDTSRGKHTFSSCAGRKGAPTSSRAWPPTSSG